MAPKITYSTNFKRNYVAFFALALFLLMILSELLLALSIPVVVQREDAFAKEVRKHRMLKLFDDTRTVCKKIDSKDEITLKEKQLLSDNLDYLALYLRKESDRLTPEDIDKLEPIVNDLYRIASKLKNSGSFAKENRLSSSSYIKFMIDQRTKKNEKK